MGGGGAENLCLEMKQEGVPLVSPAKICHEENTPCATALAQEVYGGGGVKE